MKRFVTLYQKYIIIFNICEQEKIVLIQQKNSTMFLVRNVSHAKPMKARELVEKFKKAAEYLPEFGVKTHR